MIESNSHFVVLRSRRRDWRVILHRRQHAEIQLAAAGQKLEYTRPGVGGDDFLGGARGAGDQLPSRGRGGRHGIGRLDVVTRGVGGDSSESDPNIALASWRCGHHASIVVRLKGLRRTEHAEWISVDHCGVTTPTGVTLTLASASPSMSILFRFWNDAPPEGSTSKAGSTLTTVPAAVAQHNSCVAG